ncbi:hypothetical protein CYMTET_42327 [Cymbomonas tetramitiformis]|uniref:Uncharacterized protein n=1 Tax=Cymbomonas tetramitiformis TaxID=36881 RepID=A0AAE0C4F0_9CHLO|nr:hypothetical protein CYMTET_42327 [Cymbomonas tetramitiformis]
MAACTILGFCHDHEVPGTIEVLFVGIEYTYFSSKHAPCARDSFKMMEALDSGSGYWTPTYSYHGNESNSSRLLID